MACLVLRHGREEHRLHVDPSGFDNLLLLRLQICSVTGVEPDQQVLFLRCAPTMDGADASSAAGAVAARALRGSRKSAATGSSPPPDLPPTGTDVAVLPPLSPAMTALRGLWVAAVRMSPTRALSGPFCHARDTLQRACWLISRILCGHGNSVAC